MEETYSNRKIYRKIFGKKDLYSFSLSIGETDLHIQTSEKNLEKKAEQKVIEIRSIIKEHIQSNPKFEKSLKPVKLKKNIHPVIEKMIIAGIKAGVGPMASVAGCISQELGNYLLKFSKEVIIENGGDVFISSENEFTTGIYSGKDSPFSNKIGIKIKSDTPLGICTSTGTFGHSLSFGKADAFCVISEDAYIADAFATSLCNKVKNENDIEHVLDLAKNHNEILGAIVIYKDKIGAFGNLELVRI